MKLQVLQENLSHALNIATRFSSTRAQLPVLANILFSTKKNKLLVSSTNLEMSVSLSVGAKVKKEGDITVPARTITDLVSNLISGQVNIESEKEQLKISTQNFESTVSGMNSSDFPSVPQKVGKGAVNFPRDEFLEVLASTLFAASIDETRPVLTGVLTIFKGKKVVFVATDGFRLSQNNVSLSSPFGQKLERVVLPKNALSELTRLTNEEEVIKFSYNESERQVVFGLNDAVLSSRVIEGEFPDFEKIIPKSSTIKVNLDKEEFLRAVKLASVFARDSANVVKLKVKSASLEIYSESSAHGSQVNAVDAKVRGNTKGFTIAYNYRFLEDYLNVVKGDEVQIEFGEQNTPGLFTDPKDPNFLHLIMPVRTQG